MICFPNAKINIGLNVLERRADGYHNIESVLYPVAWHDSLEATLADGFGEMSLKTLGVPIPGDLETNLCRKAYNLLNSKYKLPSVNLWLLKSIPIGAGLGGGSADAAFCLNLLNIIFKLNIGKDELKNYASQIGSDCAFFIGNKPTLITGKGDTSTPVQLDLRKYYIAIIYPHLHIDTGNAYSLVTPGKTSEKLATIISSTAINLWKDKVVNDFEEPIFERYPSLAEIKKLLYAEGALYASLTGSGSALYGIFDSKPDLQNKLVNDMFGFSSFKIWISEPNFGL
jgi:4-diphosphocytidyl-2-C-methyl-D-erythritol kinase